ncbi:ABC-type sugar transport system, permease component [Microbacterium testaceum StLB037]|uniref:ABC-type sugar transport system, permease component n=1 Tax=Microbacterium testaceum (strain StLB037) TaxID=979556 RepID=E8NF66_MICTS|nr:hypothetical protein [Microbacterium testaceum]BAJ73920.1 ABC-type sugar transport system, permease component [Microbacterium testaceum StLB037]
MDTAPAEPSRRSRREARDAQTVDVAEAPARLTASRTSDGDHPAQRKGLWIPLAVAATALVVGLVAGLLVTVAFDGAAGRSLGGAVASVIVGITGIALLAKYRHEGFLSLRGLDVLWGVVLGAIMPFVAGVFAGGGGWPAFGALSPRWLVLGVFVPYVVIGMLTVFASGLLVALTLRVTEPRLPAVWSRAIAAVVAAVAFAIIPVVFRGDVSGMPVALPVVFGVAAGIFVTLSRRLWGAIVLGIVFTTVWIAMSVAGFVLA